MSGCGIATLPMFVCRFHYHYCVFCGYVTEMVTYVRVCSTHASTKCYCGAFADKDAMSCARCAALYRGECGFTTH